MNKLKHKTIKNPNTWSSFGGSLETTHAAKNVEFYLPKFSMSKRAILDFDIIEDENSKEISFDMIIGTKGI